MIRQGFLRLEAITGKGCVALALLGALSLGVAAAVTFVDVILRFFGGSVRGVVDLVQLFVMTGVFLSMPYTFFVDGHVRVTILLDRLRPALRATILVLGGALVLAFMIMLALRTHDGLLQVMGRRDSTLNLAIPMLWFWGPMLAGFALSIPAIALVILRHMQRLPTPYESDDL
ncbi:MAG: TRAP transporter small permease [Pararhodobacter sp.]|nr:TRAP transporter small permease [Pararhodobacter sp.]